MKRETIVRILKKTLRVTGIVSVPLAYLVAGGYITYRQPSYGPYLAIASSPLNYVYGGYYLAYRHRFQRPCIERTLGEYDSGLAALRQHLNPTPQSRGPRKPNRLQHWFNRLQNKPDFERDLKPDTQSKVPVLINKERFERDPDQVFDSPDFTIACEDPPLAVEDKTLDLPTTLPAYCKGLPTPTPTPIPPEPAGRIINAAKSVGAIMVKDTMGSKYPEFWGTGFMIAQGIFATTCHTIQPLLSDKTTINAKGFSVKITFDNASSFDVQDNVTCSNKEGLDIALLTLNPASGKPPDPLPLYSDRAEKLEGQQAVFIGDADLLHFVDEHAQEMYQNFEVLKNKAYFYKFAMLDWILSDDECDSDLDILLDTPDTTTGQSGGPVALFQGNQPPLKFEETRSPVFKIPDPGILVVGVHTCCAAYFPAAEYYSYGDLPHYEDIYPHAEPGTVAPRLKCTHSRRTATNQAVSTRSILKDPDLCRVLINKARAYAADGNGGTITACPPPMTK